MLWTIVPTLSIQSLEVLVRYHMHAYMYIYVTVGTPRVTCGFDVWYSKDSFSEVSTPSGTASGCANADNSRTDFLG